MVKWEIILFKGIFRFKHEDILKIAITLLKLNHFDLTLGVQMLPSIGIMIKPLNVKCVKLVLDLSSLVNTIYSVLTKQGIEQLFQLIQ